MASGTISILIFVLAIVATTLAFVFIVPEKKRSRLNGFGKFLHDMVNFKFLIIEKIMQALYIFATAFVVLAGFFMLFYVEEGYHSYYYSTPDKWYGGYGLLTMVLGPIVIRIVYEFMMMTILLVKHVIQINCKIKNQNENSDSSDLFNVPTKNAYVAPAAPQAPYEPYAPQAPAAPQTPYAPQAPVAPEAATFCTNCGSHLNPDGTCPNCR